MIALALQVQCKTKVRSGLTTERNDERLAKSCILVLSRQSRCRKGRWWWKWLGRGRDRWSWAPSASFRHFFCHRRHVLILQVPRAGNYNFNMSKTQLKYYSLFDGWTSLDDPFSVSVEFCQSQSCYLCHLLVVLCPGSQTLNISLKKNLRVTSCMMQNAGILSTHDSPLVSVWLYDHDLVKCLTSTISICPLRH